MRVYYFLVLKEPNFFKNINSNNKEVNMANRSTTIMFCLLKLFYSLLLDFAFMFCLFFI